ncbi:RNA-binding cell elongation regulator Jag/EloR [uncultured Acidaminococcus sp.]|jgi:spoIIIJ-associated protein|uniref:RNA-binding cell elongation regulator Jag/EloR n=1 Tax=uncultured Acidaminococcus sp. TaxID=352152 RepID=UPI00265E29F2|nr:RNA-binding cell elongation regulator Jag/EloR [uncultured Acidaminococcus sp.]
MNMVEKTGKTVEDAVKAALAELGVSRDQAEVEVLEESKPSLLGLFGGRDAKVRVTVKEAEPEAPAAPELAEEAAPEAAEAPVEKTEAAPQEDTKAPADREEERQAAAAAAKAFLEEIFRAMGMDLLIEKFISRKDEEIILKIHGDGIGVLIGKHGQTLDALQYLTNLAGNRGRKNWNRIILDAENYRERRRETLERLARNLADRVKRTRKKAMLEPMNPYERKIVHMSLQNDPAVTTYSEGEEPYRKVVIDLK